MEIEKISIVFESISSGAFALCGTTPTHMMLKLLTTINAAHKEIDHV